jgi:hypothetical protein
MEENEKKTPEEPEKEGLLDKAKKIYEKADDFIDDKVEDLKKTKAFEKYPVLWTKREILLRIRSTRSNRVKLRKN